MKIRNTNEKLTIKKVVQKTKCALVGGILVSSLMLTLCVSYNNEIDDGEEHYGYYSSKYLEALAETENENFDTNFIDTYKNVNAIVINGNVYDIDSIYINICDDGKIYLTKAGENNYSLIDQTTFTGKRIKIMNIKKSSVFYELYQNGYIIDESISIDSTILASFVNSWDGKSHQSTPDTYAARVADNAYNGKYSR